MNAWLTRLALLSAAGSLALASSSCAVEDPSNDYDDVDGPVAEAQQAFGELTCGTSTYWDTTQTLGGWGSGGMFGHVVMSTSPSSSYGHAPTCPSQYTMGVNPAPYSAPSPTVHFAVAWGDTTITTSATCVASHLAVTGYTYWAGGYTVAGQATYTGHWTAALPTSFCTFQLDAGQTAPTATITCDPTSHTCGGASVAGRAWTISGGSPAYKKVTVKVSSP